MVNSQSSIADQKSSFASVRAIGSQKVSELAGLAPKRELVGFDGNSGSNDLARDDCDNISSERETMKRLRSSCRVFLLAVFWLASVPLQRVSSDEERPQDLLRALEGIRFDLKRVYPVRDISLRRDAVTLSFERGQMIFLEPVKDVVTGLLFWGHGTLLAAPADKVEKQQLNLFTGAPTLNEPFQEAFIRFSDDTYTELISQITAAAEQEPVEPAAALEQFQAILKGSVLSNYRILADLLGGRTMPMFSARVVGRTLGMIDLGYDRRKVEDLYLGQFRQSGEQTYYDNWCSFASQQRRSELSSSQFPARLIDVKQYRIDAQIDKDDRLSGVAEVEFLCEREGEWVLTFEFSRFLKISEVRDSDGRSLEFFQNSDMASEEIRKLGHDVVVVVLPGPMQRGSIKTLRFTYSGDVISRVGRGVFYVGSRGSWYPNLGTTDRATFGLRFRYPKTSTIVATGDLVKEWEEGEQRCSVWTSDAEIPVAGFNYGDYQKTTTAAQGVEIEVYANRGLENVHQEVMARMEYLRELQRRQALATHRRFPESLTDLFPTVPNFLDFDTTRFAKDIANQVANTVLLYEPILGKFPYRRLAVSQIPGRFSQGWPSLLYASSLSFLSPAQRARIGLEKDREAYFIECLHAHEIAHQWWGNLVGWKSYHDLWMFEGFSNYLGYLSMQSKYPGGRQFQDLLRFGREKLLSKNSQGKTLESAGPVWLGPRLSSSKFPEGYSTLVYEKGAWIFHMLRYLLSDPTAGSDDKFRLMTKDFMATYGGSLASTQDFQRVAEKHMSKTIDFEGNRKLDWFFDQWVYETGIPSYRLEYSLSTLKNGSTLLKGKIRQDNVSEYFIMPVEVFGHFGTDKVSRVGRVVVSGNETSFRLNLKARPQKVTLDENNQILCENKTT